MALPKPAADALLYGIPIRVTDKPLACVSCMGLNVDVVYAALGRLDFCAACFARLGATIEVANARRALRS